MYEALKRVGVTSVPCYDFTDQKGRRSKQTVIMCPIRFMEFEDGSLSISWGCSRGTFCYDSGCRYSKAGGRTEE